MKGTTKRQEQLEDASVRPRKSATATDVFTPDMRFIVTRNTRNAWMDDLYENPPSSADYPVFN